MRYLVIYILVFVSSFAHSRDDESLRNVKLQLKWTHQFQFAGYYMAKEMGYYREEGLDVDIIEGSPTVDVTEQVLSGKADFGVGTSDLLLDYAEGAPVVVLGVIYQHSPLVLIMKTDSPADSMESLVGESIMIESHAADLVAMFKHGGVSISSLNFTDYDYNLDGFMKGDFRAFSAYMTDEPFLLHKLGIDHFILSPRVYGIDFYGDNFFTHRKMLDEDEELVKGFRAATIRGWQEAIAEPERAIDLIIENYQTEKSREHLVYEATKTADLMTGLVTPGYMLMERWEFITDAYIETEMLKERPDLNDFVFQPVRDGLPKWFWHVSGIVLIVVSFLLFIATRVLGGSSDALPDLNLKQKRQVEGAIEILREDKFPLNLSTRRDVHRQFMSFSEYIGYWIRWLLIPGYSDFKRWSNMKCTHALLWFLRWIRV